MDDDSGWNDVLLGLWSPAVRAAVVTRIEAASVGRRGWLVRVFSAPDRARSGLTETVHALVLAAIRDETGADLDALGSQAAWECYEEVWAALAARWRGGGDTVAVTLGQEPEVVRVLTVLPVEAAVCAGADLDGAGGVDPLWLAGRLRVDVEGLRAYLAGAAGPVPADARAAVRRILAVVAAG